jgi:hypothetical protein
LIRFIAAVLVAAGLTWPAAAEPITVTSRPLPLNPEKPAQTTIGQLRYIAGLDLTGSRWGFGGYSGFSFSGTGGRFVAISDLGHFLSGRMTFDAEGRVTGIADADFQPMRDLDGRIIDTKRRGDAEAVRHDTDGTLLVSFERDHRVWRYAGVTAVPRPVELPPAVADWPENEGIESLAVLPGGDLLILAEAEGPGERHEGWLRHAGRWSRLAFQGSNNFLPTDAVALRNGDVLVLQRRFTWIGGVAARLGLVRAAAIVPGAVLDSEILAEWSPPLAVDNMEGIDVIERPDGAVDIFMMSDDNRNPLQRFLLLQFRWQG